MERIEAIYARQSIDKADSISIESQIEQCRHELKTKEYNVFCDRGYSGKDTERPQFQKMLELIKSGEISRVICYKLDRISRSILDFTTMMEEFGKRKVEFVSCTEKFDTSTPMGWAMLNICIVFAQLERETIQQRVTDAYMARSRKGFYMGGKIPYGYRLTPYVIDGKKTARYEAEPEEADIIRLIYSMYCEPDCSYGDVTRYLNSHDIVNSRSKNKYWNRSRIAELIKNPIYVRSDINVYNYFKKHNFEIHNSPNEFFGGNGIYAYNDKSGEKNPHGFENQHIVIAPHEGIISSDLWIKARTKCMLNKQFAQNEMGKNSWLIGKIKCGQCGYAMAVKKSGETRYMVCSHKLQTFKCRGVGKIKLDELEYNVSSQIEGRFKSMITDKKTKKYISAKNNKNIGTISTDISEKLLMSFIDNDKSVTFEDKLAIADAFIAKVSVFEDCGIIIDWK